jgi:hypothetical protein
VYRRRYNFKLQREFHSPCVINIGKTNRLRYTRHLIRIPEDLPQKDIFIGRPQGMKRKGRPKSRSPNGVNSDSRALGALDWTHQAQKRAMERTSSIGPNYKLVVAPDKKKKMG